VRHRYLLLALLVLAVVPYFVNLGATSIIDANEAFYTETPREMIERGDWISTTFNDEPRLNKPPLSYWVVGAFYEIAGVSLGAARLPIALGMLVILLTVFLIGRAAWSVDAGLVAALTLAATPRMLLFSRRIIIDVYTAMFLGLTLLCFVMAEIEPARRRRWLMAMYVAVGLGVMTKGPVAAVLPALVFAVYLVASGRVHTLRRMLLPAGALIVAVIVLPYYVALYAQHGWAYISTFFLTENLARFAEGVGAPNRGPLFYLPVVFADLYFPWSLLLPLALVLVPWRAGLAGRGWLRLVSGGDVTAPVGQARIRLLLGLWIVVIVGFFSLSKAQQDLYVLPFIAAGAPMIGGLLVALMDGTLAPGASRVARGFLTAAGVVLGLVGVLIAWYVGGSGQPIHLAGAAPAGIILAAGAVACVVWAWRRRALEAVASLAAAIVVAHWILVVWALPDFERYKPVPHLARAVLERAGPAAAVGMYKVATPSLVFYLRRHVTQMFDEDELRAFLSHHAEAYCVMTDDDYQAVSRSVSVPLHVIARAPRFEAQLDDFLTRSELPSLLLVSNK
jgi:4-amino-4-deoxy-L-arabinose transferase-like glycosyltransferase